MGLSKRIKPKLVSDNKFSAFMRECPDNWGAAAVSRFRDKRKEEQIEIMNMFRIGCEK